MSSLNRYSVESFKSPRRWNGCRYFMACFWQNKELLMWQIELQVEVYKWMRLLWFVSTKCWWHGNSVTAGDASKFDFPCESQWGDKYPEWQTGLDIWINGCPCASGTRHRPARRVSNECGIISSVIVINHAPRWTAGRQHAVAWWQGHAAAAGLHC